MDLRERLFLAISGEEDPVERGKRIEEAIQEHKAREAQKELSAAAHQSLLDQWVEKSEDREP